MKQIILSLAVVAALTFGAPVKAEDYYYEDDLAVPATAPDFAAAAARVAANHRMQLAEQGDAVAQTNLGLTYYNGDGVPQDFTEAARWFRLAAEQGAASAQYNLGVIYGTGRGAPQDYAEAARWFGLAAEQGVASAQYNLGLMYLNGHGLMQDFGSAHMWFNIASANGDTEAGTARDDLARQMTPEQEAEAQTPARVCMASGYQDCD